MGDKPKDADAAKLFDPGSLRDNPHPTNYCETLMHYTKSCLGTGIFTLPYAFKNAGLTLGTIGLFFTGLICGHCAYILVECAHKFYFYSNKTSMTYAEVADYAFSNGPECAKKFSKVISVLTSISIFLSYFGICSVYAVIIAANLQELILQYAETNIHIRLLLLILLLPFLLIVWIPNLKILAIVSTTANLFMLIGILITFYYYFTNVPNFSDRKQANLIKLPEFLANAIFALEAIGVVLPLENNMKEPKQMIGLFGVLVIGTFICTVLYWSFGFFGYIRYGDEVHGSIIQNLPTDEISGQMVKILVSLTIFGVFGLHMFICLDVICNSYLKDRFKYPLIANYITRTVLCISAVAVAIAIPVIAPFMGVIGAFCFSILGIILPVLIEILTVWKDGFGKFYWIMWKNIIVLAIGIFVLIFGTITSVLDIIQAVKDI